MHYDNPRRMNSTSPDRFVLLDRHFPVDLDRTDSSGIRFYLGKQHRQHEMGYLTFGTISAPSGITIPPQMDRFIVDTYCPANGTKVVIETRVERCLDCPSRDYRRRVSPCSAPFPTRICKVIESILVRRRTLVSLHPSQVVPFGPRSFVITRRCNTYSTPMRTISTINLKIVYLNRSNSIRFEMRMLT